MAEKYRRVTVHRDGITYTRKAPRHHKVSKAIAKREARRWMEIENVAKAHVKRARREEKMADH